MLNALIVIRQCLFRGVITNLENYNKIWERVSSLLSIKLDSEPFYGDNDKYIKVKIKLYGDKISTNFQGKKIPKENASYKCVSLIILESLLEQGKSTTLKHF